MKKKTFKTRQIVGFVMLLMASVAFFRYAVSQVGTKLVLEMFAYVILIPTWVVIAVYLITEKDGVGTDRNGWGGNE